MSINCWNIINRLALSIIFLSALFSPLILFEYNSHLGLGVLIIWLFVMLIKYKTFSTCSIMSLLTWLVLMVIPLIMGYSFVFNRYVVLSVLLLGSWVGELLYKESCWKDVKMVCILVAPFIIYVYLKTFMALLDNSYASRMIKTSGDYTVWARTQGIGGYEFVYFLAMLSGIMFGLGITLKKKRDKAICMTIFFLAYLEVVLSNYFTALLLATMTIVMCIVIKLIIMKKEWKIFFAIFSVFLLIFGNAICKIFINIVLEFIPQEGKNYIRLAEMQDAPLQNLIREFIEGRSEVMHKSMESIIENPIMGRLVNDGLGREELLSEIGQHSFFLDTFAFYGIVVGGFVLFTFMCVFRKSYFRGQRVVITIPLMISCFLLLFLNNATASIGIVLGVIYPYAMYLVERKKACE